MMVATTPSSLIETPTGPLQVAPVATTACIFSLIIPTYNERRNIAAIVDQLTRLLDRAIPGAYELIVVDDDSPDRTWEAALSLCNQYPQLRVMRRKAERGLSSAVIRGWQVARGEILGVIDADLQHPPEVLLQLLAAVQANADMAVASRHVDGGGVSEWSFIRRFLSRGAQTLGLLILPKVVGRVSDPMSGYFLVRRRAIASALLYPKGYKILLEVIGRGQIGVIAEVGYVFQERLEGESKVTWRQYVDYLHHLLRLRFKGRIAPAGKPAPLGRFLRFGLVGFSGLFVDYGVFFLLFEQLGLSAIPSQALSAEIAIGNNFLWNDAWTFADFSQQQKGWRARVKRFLKFNLICLAGLSLNLFIFKMLLSVWGVNVYIAKFIAIAAVTLWNFWLNLKLSWRVTDTPEA